MNKGNYGNNNNNRNGAGGRGMPGGYESHGQVYSSGPRGYGGGGGYQQAPQQQRGGEENYLFCIDLSYIPLVTLEAFILQLI